MIERLRKFGVFFWKSKEYLDIWQNQRLFDLSFAMFNSSCHFLKKQKFLELPTKNCGVLPAFNNYKLLLFFVVEKRFMINCVAGANHHKTFAYHTFCLAIKSSEWNSTMHLHFLPYLNFSPNDFVNFKKHSEFMVDGIEQRPKNTTRKILLTTLSKRKLNLLYLWTALMSDDFFQISWKSHIHWVHVSTATKQNHSTKSHKVNSRLVQIFADNLCLLFHDFWSIYSLSHPLQVV